MHQSIIEFKHFMFNSQRWKVKVYMRVSVRARCKKFMIDFKRDLLYFVNLICENCIIYVQSPILSIPFKVIHCFLRFHLHQWSLINVKNYWEGPQNWCDRCITSRASKFRKVRSFQWHQRWPIKMWPTPAGKIVIKVTFEHNCYLKLSPIL